MFHSLPTRAESYIYTLHKNHLDMGYVVTKADHAGLKEEQNKNILRLVYRWKTRALSLKSIFLVLIKQ